MPRVVVEAERVGFCGLDGGLCAPEEHDHPAEFLAGIDLILAGLPPPRS